ncbi:MAG TPA: DMT family transporter, partial [Firmicutes bacterium]|nr:DMT family transporter [Bacillota bacterium]
MFLVLVSATGFGALAILAKVAYGAGLSPLVALNWRFILAAFFLAGYVAVARLPWRMNYREAGVLLLLGGAGYASMSTLFFGALRFIPASAASLLLYTYPAFVTLLSRLFWRTPLTPGHWAALLLTGCGTVALLWSPGLHLNSLGTLLGLGAAVVYSFYLLANQRVTPGVNPAVASTCIIGGAALSFTVFNLASGTFTTCFTPRGWTALALMAFCST